MILAGDIGGTKTNLAFFDVQRQGLTPVIESTFQSQKFGNLDEILLKFITASNYKANKICLSIAGPVIQGRCRTTNLPWLVDSTDLAHKLGVEPQQVQLINDLEANAHGVAVLEPDELVVLNRGLPGVEGNACVISAGTGLGQAGLFWNGSHHVPFACEGGHTDFAALNQLQWALKDFLAKEEPHVSYERLLSGQGLYNIYRFLRDTRRFEESNELAEEMKVQDPPAVITQNALGGSSEICSEALSIFISIYGAEQATLRLSLWQLVVFLSGVVSPRA